MAVHAERSGGKLVALLRGHLGGVSCVRFAPDGRTLCSGSRGARDQRLLCWDLRQLDHPLLSLTRRVATNQRMQFDLTPCVLLLLLLLIHIHVLIRLPVPFGDLPSAFAFHVLIGTAAMNVVKRGYEAEGVNECQCPIRVHYCC